MAYRNDVDALEARLAAVQRDLDATTRDRDETARLLAEARDRAANEAIAADYFAGGPQRRRRRRVRHMAFGAGIALAVIGSLATYRLTRTSARDRVEATVERFQGFTAEMCQCTDKQCADRVMDDMTKWATGLATEQPYGEEMPPEDLRERMATIGQHYAECMTKAMSDSVQSRY